MSVHDLIKKYAPKQPIFDIEIMTVDLETGQPTVDTLTVKMLSGTEDLLALREKSRGFVKMLREKAPTAYKPFTDVSDETAAIALEVSELVVDPPISNLDALQMARDAGQLLLHIHNQISARNVLAAGIADKAAVEAAKGFLAQTPSTPSTSESDATTSENTPTDGTPTIGDTPANTGPTAS